MAAGSSLGDAFVEIRAVTEKLDKDLAAARGQVEKAVGGINDSLKAVGGIALGLGAAGFTALAGAMAFATSAALDNEKIQASLSQAIKASGGAAGITADMANEMAQSFVGLAGGSDDAVLAIETIGIRAGTVSAEQMPAFIQATLDLGTVMGDTAGAAELLARAQDDPIAAFKRIEKSTGAYDSALEEQIKTLQDAGDTGGAVALIMGKLAETTGGAAAANAQTLAGQWEILQGQIGEAAETVGTAILPVLHDLFDSVIAPAIPLIASMGASFADLIATGNLENLDNIMSEIAGVFEIFGFNGRDVERVLFDLENQFYDMGVVVTGTIIPAIQDLVAKVKPYIEQAAAWLEQNVSLQDVLVALGVAIAAVVIPAIAAVVGPVLGAIAVFGAVMVVAALLRKAWEEDFGGIQEKTAQVWEAVKMIFEGYKWWIENITLPALAALHDFWVNVAWPAIQKAVEIAWPIIQAIFAAIGSFIVTTLIPTVADLYLKWTTVWWPQIESALAKAWAVIEPILADVKDFVVTTLIPAIADLYSKWTTVWWPAISTALTNAWTIIETVFKELDRWINVNIVPWIEFLQKKWAEEAWPAIQKGLEDAWAVIKPIWEALQTWLEKTLPPAVEGLQKAFEPAMAAISSAVQPVKDLWDAFAKAVSDFWTWISGKVFDFHISIPDLPDWAKPGSPLPIHTAWKNFANDMGRMVVAPKFDLDAMLPVMGLVGEDGGGDRSVHYTSTTHITTNRDPMRVLRASRHLDKLGSMA